MYSELRNKKLNDVSEGGGLNMAIVSEVVLAIVKRRLPSGGWQNDRKCPE